MQLGFSRGSGCAFFWVYYNEKKKLLPFCIPFEETMILFGIWWATIIVVAACR
jgi:hypothetical protein